VPNAEPRTSNAEHEPRTQNPNPEHGTKNAELEHHSHSIVDGGFEEMS
jgi:hypothetical protein